MKTNGAVTQIVSALSLLILTSCASTKDAANKPEKGPSGTIAYLVEVESSEPGVRIEAEQDYIGTTPCTLKIFGDKDGTFHNFGQPEYVVKAYPNKPGQFPQKKVFRTGWWFTQEDRIPKRIYFDMNENPAASGGFKVDLPDATKQER